MPQKLPQLVYCLIANELSVCVRDDSVCLSLSSPLLGGNVQSFACVAFDSAFDLAREIAKDVHNQPVNT